MGRDCLAIQKGRTNQKMLIFYHIFTILIIVGSAAAQDVCKGAASACSNTPLRVEGLCEMIITGWTFQDGACSEFFTSGCCATKAYFPTEEKCKEVCEVRAEPIIECCKSKKVGGIDYNLVDNSTAAVPEQCSTPCVYEKAGYPGSQYCFAPGSLPVECLGPRCTFDHYFTINNNLRTELMSGEVSLMRIGIPPCGPLTYNNIQPGGGEYKHCIGRCIVRNVTAVATTDFGSITCTPFIRSDTEPAGSSFQVVGVYESTALLSCYVAKN